MKKSKKKIISDLQTRVKELTVTLDGIVDGDFIKRSQLILGYKTHRDITNFIFSGSPTRFHDRELFLQLHPHNLDNVFNFSGNPPRRVEEEYINKPTPEMDSKTYKSDDSIPVEFKFGDELNFVTSDLQLVTGPFMDENQLGNRRIFKDKEQAKKYILQNQPKYSEEDMRHKKEPLNFCLNLSLKHQNRSQEMEAFLRELIDHYSTNFDENEERQKICKQEWLNCVGLKPL